MNAAELLQNITSLFTQTRDCVDQLNECLLTELDCLKTNNSESLLHNSATKEALMNTLNALDQQRKNLTEAHKIESKEAYLKWLDAIDPTQGLAQTWQQISQEIQRCQKQNATNGLISTKMARASEEVLHIISGQQNIKDNTYTSDGKKPGNLSSLHNTTA